jgi:hypothetical protein
MLMLNRKRSGFAAQRFAERRQRENEAPRLRDEVPALESLRLDVEEHRAGSVVAEAPHIRRVVVENAPALFVLPCGDPTCKEGGHDVTSTVMRSLRAGNTRFEGEDACSGTVGSAPCMRVLRFVGTASYKSS